MASPDDLKPSWGDGVKQHAAVAYVQGLEEQNAPTVVGKAMTILQFGCMRHHVAVSDVQEPMEQDAPTVVASQDGSQPSGEVTAVDVATMGEEDLQEAVGLLTQLEARTRRPPSVLATQHCCHHPTPQTSLQSSRICSTWGRPALPMQSLLLLP